MVPITFSGFPIHVACHVFAWTGFRPTSPHFAFFLGGRKFDFRIEDISFSVYLTSLDCNVLRRFSYAVV